MLMWAAMLKCLDFSGTLKCGGVALHGNLPLGRTPWHRHREPQMELKISGPTAIGMLLAEHTVPATLFRSM